MSSNSSTEPESASERVGRIVELVENVLQYLLYSDIPNAQYICHQWKDIINTSKIVRARIFLAPHRLTNILEYAKANRRDRRAQRGRYYYNAKPIRGKQWHPFLHGILVVLTVNPDWPWDKPLYPSMEDAFEGLEGWRERGPGQHSWIWMGMWLSRGPEFSMVRSTVGS